MAEGFNCRPSVGIDLAIASLFVISEAANIQRFVFVLGCSTSMGVLLIFVDSFLLCVLNEAAKVQRAIMMNTLS